MSTTGHVYGGVSAADRTAERRRRLLDAGFELMGTRGVADVTIGDICAEAGLTKRYFYEQFDSIDAFVDGLMGEIVEQLAALVAVDDAVASGPDWARSRLAVFVEAMTSDPRLARLVFVETFGAGGSLAGLRQLMIHTAVEVMISEFLPPRLDGAEVDAAALRMTAYALSGACAELLLAWVQGELEATSEQVVDYLVGLFSRVPELVAGA